jgi:hypothetical protein
MLSSIKQFYSFLKTFLDLSLVNFDPSLLQNIIISILAIFIPFVIVFLTAVLNSEKQRSNLTKKVLINEIFSPKKIFWLSVIGIILFSLFAGENISTGKKLAALLLAIIIIALFLSSFKKMLKFSEGNITELEFLFLKKSKFSKIFRKRNKQRGQKMIEAWESFWSAKNIFDERKFISIYISRINTAFELKMFDVGVKLSETLLNNIENRDYFIIYNEILSNTLMWDELLWNEQQKWLKNYSKVNKSKTFWEKYTPTFKKIFTSIFKHKKDEYFWQWNFFHNRYLTKITDLMLTTGQDAFQFFDIFKSHLHQAENKLNLLIDQDEKNKYFIYVTNLISDFTRIFYDKVSSASSQYSIWEDYFPEEWKITSNNSNNNISRIILNEFLKWSRDRIIRDNKQDFDNNLTNVINGLFPNIDSLYFSTFIIWYLLYDLKNVVAKEINFYVLSVGVSWAGEMDDKQIDEMFREKENAKKEETIKIIMGYFSHSWSVMSFYDTDLTESEKNDWENIPIENKKSIINKIRIKNLEKHKAELESSEFIEICSQNISHEHKRNALIELISLLINYVSTQEQ